MTGSSHQAGLSLDLPAGGENPGGSRPCPDVTELVVDTLTRFRYTGLHELDYQDQVEHALSTVTGLRVTREVRLTGRDRIDLVVNDTIGIEVKVDSTRAAIIRQVGRYAASGRLTHIVLASSRVMLTKNLPEVIHGVPLIPVVLRGRVL